MRSSRRAHASASASTVIVATAMTLTPLERAGPVVHGEGNCRKPKVISNTHLDKNSTPCPRKATDTLISNVTSNLMNTDANCDQILKCLAPNNKNLDLFNNINPKLPSPNQKNLTTKRNKSKLSETTVPTRESFKTLGDTADPP